MRVTKDVIDDPQKLTIKAIYNGQIAQDGTTRWVCRCCTLAVADISSDTIFDVGKQISYLSQGTTLEAGIIFLSGTPAGIGYFRKPQVVLEDGGDIRVHIEKIGTLINKVKYEEW